MSASGLTGGVTYYYRCYATNSAGEDWANDTASFTTELATVEFALTNSSGGESVSPANLEVTLSATSAVDVTVNVASADRGATAGSDYTATNGTLTIPAGSVSVNIGVEILTDREDGRRPA